MRNMWVMIGCSSYGVLENTNSFNHNLFRGIWIDEGHSRWKRRCYRPGAHKSSVAEGTQRKSLCPFVWEGAGLWYWCAHEAMGSRSEAGWRMKRKSCSLFPLLKWRRREVMVNILRQADKSNIEPVLLLLYPFETFPTEHCCPNTWGYCGREELRQHRWEDQTGHALL